MANTSMVKRRTLVRGIATLFVVGGLLTKSSALQAADGTWTQTTAGPFNWNDTANWSGGIIADLANFTAFFTSDLAAGQTVNLSAAQTIGNITFTDSTTSDFDLTISGANTLTLDRTSGVPVIDVTQAGRTLTISSIVAGNDGLQKNGLGTLVLSGANTFTGGTTVSAGTLQANVNATQNALGTGAVSIPSGSTLVINNTQTANATTAVANVFTGTGLLKLQFAAGTTARNTTMANVGGFTGTIQLSSLGSTGDKWNVASLTVNAPVIVDSGTQIFVNGGTSTFTNGITVSGTGNSENRGAIRLAGTLGGNITLVGNTSMNTEGGTILGGISSGAAGTQTLTLGTTGTGAATLRGVIGGGTGTIALTKANFASTVTLTNTNTYTGTTTISGGTLQLGNGTSGNDGSIANGSNITNNATLAYNLFGSSSYSGNISGTGAVTKSGIGTQTLSGTDTYAGATTINAGRLIINGTSSGAGAVTVVGGFLGGTGSVNRAVSLTTAGGIDLRDGAVGPLTLGSTLASTGAAGANNLFFELGNTTGTSDSLSVAGATTITTAGAAVINFTQLGGLAGRPVGSPTTYTLIGGAGTLAGADFDKFSLSTTAAFGQTFTLTNTSDDLQLVATNVTATTPAASWAGSTDNNWSTAGNWRASVAGNDAVASAPDYQTNVTFSTTAPVPANLATNVLDVDFDINSLNFNDAAGGVTIGGTTRTLTIEATNANGNSAGNGINSANTSGTNTISTKVGLAASQTWTVATGGSLAVSGVVTDFGLGNGLTKAGDGTLTLSSAATAYTGPTVISAGTLSLVGTTAFASPTTVNPGTTLRYAPIANTSSTSIFATVNLQGALVYNTAGNFFQTVAAPVTVNAPSTISLTAAPSGTFSTGLYLDGGLQGSADLTVTSNTNGVGLVLRTVASNYSGTMTVNGNASAAIGLGSGLAINGPVSLSNANLTINGTLELGNAANNQGWAASGTAPNGLTLSINSLNGTGVIVSNMPAASSTRTLSVGNNGGSGTFSGVIANGTNNTLSFTKTGAGTQILSGANTYTGATTVSAGSLTLSGNRTVAATGGFTIGNVTGVTATLNVTNGTFTVGASGSNFLLGTGVGGIGILNQSGGSLTTTGNQLLIGNGTGNGTYNLSAGTLTTIAGGLGVTIGTNTGSTGVFNLSGTGTLTMPATSTLQITRSDNNAASGITGTFNQTAGTATVGILQMGGSATGPANNANNNATLNLTGGTFAATTFNVLSGGNNSTSTITIGGTAQVTLPVFPTNAKGAGATATITFDSGATGFLSPAAASATYMPAGTFTNAFLTANGANFNVPNGRDITVGQVFRDATSPAAAGTFTKSGVGTLTLTGANLYTGGTSVSVGTLLVNNTAGSGTGTAQVTVNGGTLGGNGIISGAVTVNTGGTLAAGNSIDSLATGALTQNAGSTFAYELNNDALPGVAGDLTAVTGNLTLDAGNAALLTLTELGAGSWTPGEKLTLISYSGNLVGGLFNYSGSPLADDSTFTFSGVDWLFNYNDTAAGSNYTGDLTGSTFVTMTAVTPIPEPSTLVLGGLALLGLAGMNLRRRRMANQG